MRRVRGTHHDGSTSCSQLCVLPLAFQPSLFVMGLLNLSAPLHPTPPHPTPPHPTPQAPASPIALAQWEAVAALGACLAPAPLWAEGPTSTSGVPADQLALELVAIAWCCEPDVGLLAGLSLAAEAALRVQFEQRGAEPAPTDVQRQLGQLEQLLSTAATTPRLTADLMLSGFLHELLSVLLPWATCAAAGVADSQV